MLIKSGELFQAGLKLVVDLLKLGNVGSLLLEN